LRIPVTDEALKFWSKANWRLPPWPVLAIDEHDGDMHVVGPHLLEESERPIPLIANQVAGKQGISYNTIV